MTITKNMRIIQQAPVTINIILEIIKIPKII